MPSKLSDIETLSRQRLIEITPRFWTSQELIDIISAGIRDLWRDIADLKQEHFLVINTNDVYFDQGMDRLSGVPKDVHKIYLIEALDLGTNSVNSGLQFMPLEYNHRDFQLARSRETTQPSNDTFYYSIANEGGPVNSAIVLVAPQTTTRVDLRFCYVPVLGDFTKDSDVLIPGESTNALVSWTVAFARAKERDDRAPDPGWLAIYATEKQHLLQSLGLRQYQEPKYADAEFAEYW